MDALLGRRGGGQWMHCWVGERDWTARWKRALVALKECITNKEIIAKQ